MDKITIDQKKAERLTEWNDWIASFLELNEENPASEYTAVPYAAELLNDFYWRLTCDFIKPMLAYTDQEEDHNIHYYKIISASELSVMAVCPFKFIESHKKEDTQNLNAEFAFFVATSIMLNWKISGKEVITTASLAAIINEQELIDVIKGENKFYPINFRDEHIEWLKSINTAVSLPVLSNSHTWRLCYLAAKALETSAK